MRMLLRICSLGEDPLNATGSWTRNATGKVLCEGCNAVNRSLYPAPLDIDLYEYPDGIIVAPVSFIGVCVFRRDFIERMLPYMSNYALGKCFYPAGQLVEDYVTCYTKKYIAIRGQEGSEYKICTQCQTVRSLVKHPAYIPGFYLSDDRVYMDRSCNMYVDQELCLELCLDKYDKIEFDAFPVRDGVVDGQHLPIDPPLEYKS